MMDYAIQRTNMVESQVRTADVTDRRIIRAMLAVPREAFAPGPAKTMAYMDANLPIGLDRGPRFLLAPRTLAKLVQLLDIDNDNVVLDIACGTGYSTAILASIAGKVVGLEDDAMLAEFARNTLAAQNVANAEVQTGPLTVGVPALGPFDAILINGCIASMPEALLDQLKDGGRLAAIVAEGSVGKATLWRRRGTAFDSRPAFDAGGPVLFAFEKARGFVF